MNPRCAFSTGFTDNLTTFHSLSTIWKAHPKISNRYWALNFLVPPNSTAETDRFRDLVDETVADAAQACHKADKDSEDARSLLNMIRDYKDAAFFQETFVPIPT